MDYYRLLGLERGATSAEVKRAFLRIANENHPDKQGGNAAATERFKVALEAYEVLKDPVKRRAYDSTVRGGRHVWEPSWGGRNRWSSQHSGNPRPQPPPRPPPNPLASVFDIQAMLRGFTRVDTMMHLAMAAVGVGTLFLAGQALEAGWRKKNAARLFDVDAASRAAAARKQRMRAEVKAALEKEREGTRVEEDGREEGKGEEKRPNSKVKK